MGERRLFDRLPIFPPALQGDELHMLASLPDLDTMQQIEPEEEAVARRLEKRGLVKISRQKDDPLAIRPTMWAGRLPAAKLREVPNA